MQKSAIVKLLSSIGTGSYLWFRINLGVKRNTFSLVAKTSIHWCQSLYPALGVLRLLVCTTVLPGRVCDVPAEKWLRASPASAHVDHLKQRGSHGISSFLFLVRPGAPSSVLAPSSDALCS